MLTIMSVLKKNSKMDKGVRLVQGRDERTSFVSIASGCDGATVAQRAS